MTLLVRAGPRVGVGMGAAGYDGEHNALVDLGWSVVEWKAQGGYGNRSEVGKANATKERLWFSPGCIQPDAGVNLFEGYE